MTLSSLDYWRLADELSVIDAAILITGNDPEKKAGRQDDYGDHNWVQDRDYEGFEATFKALRLAVLSDKLRATVAFRARDRAEINDGYYVNREPIPVRKEIDIDDLEVRVPFDTLIRASDYKVSIFTNRELSTLSNATTLYVLKEPSWEETTVFVDDLKAWLSSKGLAPSFFFPQGKAEGFRDPAHPRYSPKLACAVAAWEAVKKPKPNASPKATIEEWIHANAVRFEMVGKDGVPTTKAVSEVAAVVNWATTGGAVPTYAGAAMDPDEQAGNIDNFNKARPPV